MNNAMLTALICVFVTADSYVYGDQFSVGKSESAGKARVIGLSQDFFSSPEKGAKTTERFRFSTIQGERTEWENLPDTLKRRIEDIFRRRLSPGIDARTFDVLLGCVRIINKRDSLPASKEEVDISRGTNYSALRINHETEEWLPEIDAENNSRIYCLLRSVSMLELIVALAEWLKLQVGIMNDGYVILGFAGKWAANYEPAYVISFSPSARRKAESLFVHLIDASIENKISEENVGRILRSFGQIESAKERWKRAEQKADGARPTWDDLRKYHLDETRLFRPAGGDFVIGALGEPVRFRIERKKQ